jgi:hypothetical protein
MRAINDLFFMVSVATMAFAFTSHAGAFQEPSSPKTTFSHIDEVPIPIGHGEKRTVVPHFSLTAQPAGIYGGYVKTSTQFTNVSMLRSSVVIDSLKLTSEKLTKLRSAVEECEGKQYAYLQALFDFKYKGTDSTEVIRCFNELQDAEMEALKLLTSQQLKTLESWRHFVLLRNHGPQFLLEAISNNDEEDVSDLIDRTHREEFKNGLEVAKKEVQLAWEICLDKWQNAFKRIAPETDQFDFPQSWYESPLWAEYAIAMFCGEDQSNLKKILEVLDCKDHTFSKFAGLHISFFTDVDGRFVLTAVDYEDGRSYLLNFLIGQAGRETISHGSNEFDLLPSQMQMAIDWWDAANQKIDFYILTGCEDENFGEAIRLEWRDNVLQKVFLTHQRQHLDAWFLNYFKQSIGPFVTLAISDTKARLKLKSEFARAAKQLENELMTIEERLVAIEVRQLRDLGAEVEPVRPPWLKVSPAAISVRE